MCRYLHSLSTRKDRREHQFIILFCLSSRTTTIKHGHINHQNANADVQPWCDIRHTNKTTGHSAAVRLSSRMLVLTSGLYLITVPRLPLCAWVRMPAGATDAYYLVFSMFLWSFPLLQLLDALVFCLTIRYWLPVLSLLRETEEHVRNGNKQKPDFPGSHYYWHYWIWIRTQIASY